MIFFTNPLDMWIARVLHVILMKPWAKITGRSHLSLAYALWYCGWPAIGAGTLLQFTQISDDALVGFIVSFGVGISTTVLSFSQFQFLLEVRLFIAELTRCIKAGDVSPKLARLARGQSVTRQYYLGLSLMFLLFSLTLGGNLAFWAPAVLLMALQRYALTDLHFGGGKSVLAKAMDQVKSMDLGVKVQPA